jgi:hypothetical protein
MQCHAGLRHAVDLLVALGISLLAVCAAAALFARASSRRLLAVLGVLLLSVDFLALVFLIVPAGVAAYPRDLGFLITAGSWGIAIFFI